MFLSGMAALSLEMVWLKIVFLEIGSAGLSATITFLYTWQDWDWFDMELTIVGHNPYARIWTFRIVCSIMGVYLSFFLHYLSPFSLTDHHLYIDSILPIATASSDCSWSNTSCSLFHYFQSQRYLSVVCYQYFGAVLGVLLSLLLSCQQLAFVERKYLLLCVVGIVGIVCFFVLQNKYKPKKQEKTGSIPIDILIAAGIVGASSMALEIIWSRLGALLIGGSVYAFAVVLAVFFLGIAIGANLSQKTCPKKTSWHYVLLAFSNHWLYCLEMVASWTRVILGMVWRWKSITNRCNIVGSSDGWCTNRFW